MINFTNTGHVPSINDYRTHDATSSLPTTITNQTLDPKVIGGIMMQAKQPACTCFAVVEAMKVYFLEKTGKAPDFEPAFLYSLYLKKYNQPIGSGSDMLSVLKLAQQYGCATKNTLNRDVNVSLASYGDSNISASAYTEALNYRIPGFSRIGTDIQSIRKALVEYKIVMTARTIGQEWWTNTRGVSSWSSNDINPLRTPTSPLSAHATCDIGFVQGDDMNLILNHWSPTWGNNGTVLYKGSDLSKYVSEAFVINVVPIDYIHLIAQLPPEKEFKYNFTQNLSSGMKGNDIQALQIVLMIDGFLTVDPSISLGYFGPATVSAVNTYQVAHRDAILTPSGLTKPTGIVGPNMRLFINSKFN